MTVLATDAFTGTDGTALPTYSSNWVNGSGSVDDLFIRSNAVGIDDTPSFGLGRVRYAGISWPDDQYAQAIIVARPDADWFTMARMAAAAQTYYGGGYNGSSWGIADMTFKVVAGTFTILEELTQTFVATDVVRLETEGTSIRLFRNGVQRGSGVTDSAIASGSAGISVANTTGNTTAYLDTFEGGDFSSGPLFGPMFMGS